MNQSVDDPSIEIESLLLMPVKHISNYAQFVDGIFNEYKTRSLMDNEFKTIAAVEIEIKKLQKMVSENYTLNSMKGSIVSSCWAIFACLKEFQLAEIVSFVTVHLSKIRNYRLFR